MSDIKTHPQSTESCDEKCGDSKFDAIAAIVIIFAVVGGIIFWVSQH